MNKRYELINYLIKKYGYKRYLEIGIDNPNNCYAKIECQLKNSIDPFKGKNSATHFKMSSNQFFRENDREYDIVFIDGLHLYQQVANDIENSLNCLSQNGTIIVHDCNPTKESETEEARTSARWFGTVYKAWTYYRCTREDISMRVWMCDCGCGIIRKGKQKLYAGDYGTWIDFVNNRKEILLPIATKELYE